MKTNKMQWSHHRGGQTIVTDNQSDRPFDKKETEAQTSQRDTPKYVEHQAIEVAGKDGKSHQLWAHTAKEAFNDATRWSYRHGGLVDVYLLVLRDENEGCWDRAKRVPITRQCNLQLIAQREASNLNISATNTATT